MHTDISATPRLRKANGVNGIEEEDADHDDNFYDDDGSNFDVALSTPPAHEEPEMKKLANKPKDRKQSVVSVSTTISLRTESISPRPDSDFHPDDAFNIGKEALLARLGETPFLRSLLLLAEMSSEGHLMTPEYRQKSVEIARANRQFVMGFIAQRSLNTEPEDNFITMTPGCQLPPPGQEGQKLGDALGQQYNTPRKLILEQGCDIIIVGRGIVRAQNRVAEAERYRAEGWKAYTDRVGSNAR